MVTTFFPVFKVTVCALAGLYRWVRELELKAVTVSSLVKGSHFLEPSLYPLLIVAGIVLMAMESHVFSAVVKPLPKYQPARLLWIFFQRLYKICQAVTAPVQVLSSGARAKAAGKATSYVRTVRIEGIFEDFHKVLHLNCLFTQILRNPYDAFLDLVVFSAQGSASTVIFEMFMELR